MTGLSFCQAQVSVLPDNGLTAAFHSPSAGRSQPVPLEFPDPGISQQEPKPERTQQTPKQTKPLSDIQVERDTSDLWKTGEAVCKQGTLG